MVRFEKLFVPEVLYPYVDAICKAEVKNGTFGTVAEVAGAQTFTAGAGNMCVMQVELGDDAHTDEYAVSKTHVRVADMEKCNGLIVNITAEQLPDEYEVGNILTADATGKLKTGGTEGYKIIEVTDYGVRAVITFQVG